MATQSMPFNPKFKAGDKVYYPDIPEKKGVWVVEEVHKPSGGRPFPCYSLRLIVAGGDLPVGTPAYTNEVWLSKSGDR